MSETLDNIKRSVARRAILNTLGEIPDKFPNELELREEIMHTQDVLMTVWKEKTTP